MKGASHVEAVFIVTRMAAEIADHFEVGDLGPGGVPTESIEGSIGLVVLDH